MLFRSVCHPRPCERYNHGTVVEFYCDPGYSLTSDYKYLTCQDGQWFPSYQVHCVKSGEQREVAAPSLPRREGHRDAETPRWGPRCFPAPGQGGPLRTGSPPAPSLPLRRRPALGRQPGLSLPVDARRTQKV